MQLRTELAATVVGFVALNLLLVFTAIGLFARMGPAIERILQRNDASIVAAEEVLETLAVGAGAPVQEREIAAIRQAIGRARGNITEVGEERVLDAIEASLQPALAGAPDARRALVARVHELIAVNRAAMQEVDRDAQHIGSAGAWVAAFVGLLSLALSLFLTRSLARRVLLPVGELRATLAAATSGDRFRRCATKNAAPELRQALDGVNQLLDRVAPPAGVESSGPSGD